MPERFLECFYSKNGQREDTRFYNEFGTNNIPFGIACGPARKAPSVSVRHNDLVFFLDDLAKSGYLPTIRETTKKTFSEVTALAYYFESFTDNERTENPKRIRVTGQVRAGPGSRSCPRFHQHLSEMSPELMPPAHMRGRFVGDLPYI
jgi:hypothetical protein